jgi:hypothetical protein
MLAEHFFPPPSDADLSDIQGYSCPEPRLAKQEVEEADVIKSLRRLAPDKAPGSKKIINRYLKSCGKKLAPVLAIIFSRCGVRGMWFEL